MARTLIPYYEIKYQAIEAANLMIECWQHEFEKESDRSQTSDLKNYSMLNKKYPNIFTKSAISAWLTSIDSYSVSKTPRRRFKTPKVVVTHLHEQLEIDLTSVENLSKSNDGVRFLLFAIDVFSRYLWVKPLKDKKGKTILTALRAILDGIKLSKIRSDKGSEFVNAPVKNYLKKKGIYFFTTNNPVKASLVERVQRTFKQRLFRYFRNKRNDRYIDDLQKLVNNYNLTPHSSLIWLVGCFGFKGPLRQYFSLYRAVSQREGERGERIDESKNVQTTPTRT